VTEESDGPRATKAAAMWGELPKLFGKSFAIGYFLPATAILLATLAVASNFGYYDILAAVLIKGEYKEWSGVAISLFMLWMVGVILMALNRPIVRIFEGYNRWNPLRILLSGKRRSFARLDAALDVLRRESEEAEITRSEWPAARADLYSKLLASYSQEYPDQIDDVLPTRFGNAIRAFEVYSGVVYGLEAIDGWPRLLAVIPGDYRQMIDDAKAQVDFWVNLWMGGLLTAFLYAVLFVVDKTAPKPWIPLVGVLFALVAGRGARAVVGDWGALVMSAFDLFRGDLCKKLGYKMPATIDEEREMWNLLSDLMALRYSRAAGRLARFRDVGGGGTAAH
jgi:hypothetical protein